MSLETFLVAILSLDELTLHKLSRLLNRLVQLSSVLSDLIGLSLRTEVEEATSTGSLGLFRTDTVRRVIQRRVMRRPVSKEGLIQMNIPVGLGLVHIGVEHPDLRSVESFHKPLKLRVIRSALEFLDTKSLEKGPARSETKLEPRSLRSSSGTPYRETISPIRHCTNERVSDVSPGRTQPI